MRIRPVGVELFHADRQTGRHDEANSRFRILRTHLKMVHRLKLQAVVSCRSSFPKSSKTGGDAESFKKQSAEVWRDKRLFSFDSRHSVLIVHRLVVADRRSFESAGTDTSLPASLSLGPSFNTATGRCSPLAQFLQNPQLLERRFASDFHWGVVSES